MDIYWFCLLYSSYTNDLGTDILEEDIPADYVDQANEYREKLIEAVAETEMCIRDSLS